MTDATLGPTVDDVLAGAESLLDTHGWVKGVFWGPDGSYCLLGAMREAAVGRDRGRLFGDPAYNAACKAVGNQVPGLLGRTPTERIMLFNDEGRTTKEDIMSVLSAAREAIR